MRRFRSRLVPLAAGLAGLLVAAPSAAESVTFGFAPPVDQRFELRDWGTLTIKWGGNRQEIAMGERASWTASRAGDGYRLDQRNLEVALAKDGKPHEEPLLKAVAQDRVVYTVARDGVLRSLDGLRRNAERRIALLEGDAKESAKKRLEERREGEFESWRWFDRHEIFLGQTLELDRDYWFRSAFPSDEGWIPMQVLFRLGPWEETPAGRRLRLNVAYTQNARALVPDAEEVRAKVRTRFDPTRADNLLKKVEIRGNSSRLVDPATGMLWRDQSFLRLAFEVRPIEEFGMTVALEIRTDFTLSPAAP